MWHFKSFGCLQKPHRKSFILSKPWERLVIYAIFITVLGNKLRDYSVDKPMPH